MIERYRAAGDTPSPAPRAYGLDLGHKHVPEMTAFSGLASAPLFTPMVGGYYKGMVVYVPLTDEFTSGPCDSAKIREILAARYTDEPCVEVAPLRPMGLLEDGYLSPEAANDTNRLDLLVFGDDHNALVAARLDNLGKGAAGVAVQNMNLMLGMPELEGLVIR